MKTIKSELTLNQFIKYTGLVLSRSVKIKYNGKVIVDEDNCYTDSEYMGQIENLFKKYGKRKIISARIKVVHFHHFEIDIRGN